MRARTQKFTFAAITPTSPPADCVHVQVHVHGYRIDVTFHVGLWAEASCAFLRSKVEELTGLTLPNWSDFTAFNFDYNESMRDLLARAESMDDDFKGVVMIDASEYRELQGTPYEHADVHNDLLDMEDYVSAMQGLDHGSANAVPVNLADALGLSEPPPSEHRRLKVILENYTKCGKRIYVESVDTGVSMSYLWRKFDQGIPHHMLQFVYRGRLLPTSGPFPVEEGNVGPCEFAKIKMQGNLLGAGGKRCECPECGRQVLKYEVDMLGKCNHCVQRSQLALHGLSQAR